MSLLDVHDLYVHFHTTQGVVKAVNGISFNINKKESLALVGESGCGKSVTSMSLLGLTNSQAEISGEIFFEGTNLLSLSQSQFRKLRGNELAMIFQNPLSALHPFYCIGDQLSETLRAHQNVTRKAAKQQCLKMLARVGIPQPNIRFNLYPHQLSGGMRQRVMIAMALINQ